MAHLSVNQNTGVQDVVRIKALFDRLQGVGKQFGPRCHRRIIADYLLVAGERVFHILGPKTVAPASLTKVAAPQADGALTYPAQAAKASNIDGSMSLPR
jgi:hypothetical protein